jgi:flagellar hook-associated protein 3 FlgL
MVNPINRFGDMATQNLSNQISTGRVLNSFQDSGEQTARIVNLEIKLSNLEGFDQGEKTLTSRMEKIELVTRQLQNIASDLRVRAIGVADAGSKDTGFRNYCKIQLEAVGKLMNSKDEDGRYLFGGQETETPPVDLSKLNAPAQGDPVNYAYYQGTNAQAVGIIGDDQVVSYGVTANQDGFAKLISALKIGSTIGTSNDAGSPDYQKLKQDLLPMAEAAAMQIPDLLEEIGETSKMLEQSALRQESVKAYTQELLASLTVTNFPAAHQEFQQAYIGLQYSMMVMQKMDEGASDLLRLLRG